ncbi:MAG: hypothetical protein L0Z53_16960, partial [Acidobacteriales bacterium]|nr:hypothetical protein [Terriglobales bacterium]
VIGLIAALVWDDGAAAFFRYVRDLITIGLALTSMVIVIGIGILVVQIARLVNLLSTEVKPISDDTKLAVRNVRTTTEFVQKRTVEPIIQTYAFLAGLTTFLLEIVRLSRMLQQRDNEVNNEPEVSEDASQ